MTNVLLGLVSGIFFGIVIQRVGATDANRMARAHLMLDATIPQFMLLAVSFAILGLYGLQSVGLGHTVILPTSLVATGLAAILFGIGWGLAGYCPGTCWAAVGEGRMDAVFAFIGAFAGTAAFAHLHEKLIPVLYTPTNLGQLTLDNLFGSRMVSVIVAVLFLLTAVWAIGRFWRHGS